MVAIATYTLSVSHSHDNFSVKEKPAVGNLFYISTQIKNNLLSERKITMKMKKIAILLAFIISLVAVPCAVSAADEVIATAKFTSRVASTSNMSSNLLVHQPTVETVEDVKGWRLDCSSANLATICCNIKDSVLYNSAPETTYEIDVTYYNDSYGGFMLYYDAIGGKKGWEFVQMTPTNTWETHTFTVYDARFTNGISGGYDFQIIANDKNITSDEQSYMGASPYNVLISSVELRKISTVSPYRITAETKKPGNIFLENDIIKFSINCEDLSGNYPVVSMAYAVKEYYNGTDIQTGTITLSNGKGTLRLKNLPYNVYELHLTPLGENVDQVQVIDFSRTRTSDEINMRYGTNIHFNWNIYEMDDIKALADLAKNAGYGFTRTSHNWNEIETKGNLGSYKISDKLMYANKYLDEIGLEMLAIFSCGHSAYASYPYWLEGDALEAYGKFCYEATKQLKPYTDYFTAPNEFNLTTGGTHNPENYPYYVNITKEMYENTTAAHPDAFISSGAVGRYEAEWIENCYKNGILNYCDAFSMHVYDTLGGPETWYIYPTMQEHHDLLASYDSTKEAWITENGWSTRKEEFANLTANAVASESRQAKWYPRSFAINSDPNRIDKYFHYAFADNGCAAFEYEHNFGVLHSHNYRTPFAAKPAYVSACAFNDIVGNATWKGDLDYKNDGYAYKYVNNENEEIYCIWKKDNSKAASFYLMSSKPYLEVYDMYGNMTVVENKGFYKVTQEENPCYVKCVDEIEVVDTEGKIILDSTDGVWFIEEEDSVDISVEMPLDEDVDVNVSLIMAAYDIDGALVASDVKSVYYDGNTISETFVTSGLPQYDTLKFFVFDGVSTIRPIVKSKKVAYFGDDENVSVSISDGIITISGIASSALNQNCIITAFDETARKYLINEGTYADYILYQDIGKTSASGAYTFTFELPEDYAGDSVCVQISAKDFATQKTIYLK